KQIDNSFSKLLLFSNPLGFGKLSSICSHLLYAFINLFFFLTKIHSYLSHQSPNKNQLPYFAGLLKFKLLGWQQKNLPPKTQRKVEISTAKRSYFDLIVEF
ncbi:hypothetical protein P5D95_25000, partial [Vibrio parahaemolyticus]|nr:hypothetical protein [Vibrio parahaemolyticus]